MQLVISLPEDLSRWVEERALQEGYDDPAEYMRDLLQRERDRVEKRERLQAAIDEGRRSGVSDRDPVERFAELRNGLRPN